MSRLEPLRPDAMSAAQRALYDALLSGKRGAGLTAPDGSLIGPFNAILRNPHVGNRMQSLGEALRFDTSLSRRVIEIATLVVGAHWRAQFEWWAHERLARQAGLSEAVIAAIKRGERPALDDASEATAYDVATEIYRTQRLSGATYTRAIQCFGEAGVFELLALLGYYTLVSLLLNGFDVPLAPGETPPFADEPDL
jgi:4-carboxymuconolactone decarboxylase